MSPSTNNEDKHISILLNFINSNKCDEALNYLDNLIIKNSTPIYENLKGVVLAKKNLKEDSKKQFLKTINIYPLFPDAYYNLGTILLNEKDYISSQKYLSCAVQLRDNYYEAIFNLANVYRFLKNYDEAIKLYLSCVKIYEEDSELYNCLGICYQKKKIFSQSISFFNKSLKLKPDSYQVMNNLALVYYEMENFLAASNLLNQVILMNDKFWEGHINLGNIARDLKNFDKAFFHYNKAVEINSSSFQAYYNLARLKIDREVDFFGAILDLQKAIDLNPKYYSAYSLLASSYLEIFDHENALFSSIKSVCNDDKSEVDLFSLCSYIFNSNFLNNFDKKKYFDLTKKFSQISKVIEINSCSINKNTEINLKNINEIKIGFFSPDFCNHAVGYQLIGLIDSLSKYKEIKIYAFYNKKDEDTLTQKFKKYFYHWTNLFSLSSIDAINLIKNHNLDIAIDLAGYTKDSLNHLFVNRIAKKQITWCGYLNSSGIPNMDYILGDKFVFPHGSENLYSEKLLKLSYSWSNLSVNNNVNINSQLPCEKNNFITFGSFNNMRKCNDQLFNAWSKILLSVQNSVLLLKNKNFKNEEYKNYVINKFEKLNVSSSRLILETSSKRNELLNTYNKVDIALDTFPYGGGTTTLEAYSMCVPVITLVGETFLSRCGYSINCNLGLEDWCSNSFEEYISKAISYSMDIEKLINVRKYLLKKTKESPVFNSNLFAEDFVNCIRKVI